MANKALFVVLIGVLFPTAHSLTEHGAANSLQHQQHDGVTKMSSAAPVSSICTYTDWVVNDLHLSLPAPALVPSSCFPDPPSPPPPDPPSQPPPPPSPPSPPQPPSAPPGTIIEGASRVYLKNAYAKQYLRILGRSYEQSYHVEVGSSGFGTWMFYLDFPHPSEQYKPFPKALAYGDVVYVKCDYLPDDKAWLRAYGKSVYEGGLGKNVIAKREAHLTEDEIAQKVVASFKVRSYGDTKLPGEPVMEGDDIQLQNGELWLEVFGNGKQAGGLNVDFGPNRDRDNAQGLRASVAAWKVELAPPAAPSPPLTTPPPLSPPTYWFGDRLNAGERLLSGQWMTSENGVSTASLQGDGNLVVKWHSTICYATNTYHVSELKLGVDGHLRLNDANGQAHQTSAIYGGAHCSGCYLKIWNDCALALMNGDGRTVMWNSKWCKDKGKNDMADCV